MNLGTEKDPQPIFISSLLSPEEEIDYIKLLRKDKDVFAWTYKEMPRLNSKVVVHQLAIMHGFQPIKQAQCHLWPEMIPRIEA